MYKLNILSYDLTLIEKMNDIATIQVKKISEKDIINSDCDALVISNQIININTVLSIKNDNIKCFYLSNCDDEFKNIDLAMLKVKNIIVIPPKRTVEQIIKLIIDNMYNISNENNVFSFFGADSKVGATSICQNTAIELSKRHKNKNILLLFLDGQDGFDWVKKENGNKSLADVKFILKNNLLTQKNFKDNCYTLRENLFLLMGETNIKDNVYYHQNEINELIQFCNNIFDIVLIDAGNTMNLQLRMTYSALINSDNKILVTDQLPKSYELYSKGKEQILTNLKIDNFKFIVLNKYLKSNTLYKKNEIIEKYKLPILCTIPFVEFYEQAVIEKDSTTFCFDSKYKAEILSLIKYIESKVKLPYVEKVKKRMFRIKKSKVIN
ncbi:hypothetical protein JYG23_09470 [Sedimentibacter sp. zth1]|uniref:hypothetical protein n=1 Tax=Sedimentibacter sp. zth1 TaxID=2816908 RepID=UPI001A91FFFC|nr:hypothetical protein [Sedimentibacter sp. zth1]QSX04920.1 hypothetical protein JYG23_09470 [Sedimentibacter sp. zth1]